MIAPRVVFSISLTSVCLNATQFLFKWTHGTQTTATFPFTYPCGQNLLPSVSARMTSLLSRPPPFLQILLHSSRYDAVILSPFFDSAEVCGDV